MTRYAAAPLLALALLIPLGAGAADPASRDGGAYVELLKQQDEFLSMTEREQRAYVEQAIDFINSDDPYERERNRLLPELSAATLELQDAADAEKARIEDRIDDVLDRLEEFGVVSEDRLEGNEQFYTDKYEEAKDRLSDDDDGGGAVLTVAVDYDAGDAGLHDKAAALFHAIFRSLDIQFRAVLAQASEALEQLARALG